VSTGLKLLTGSPGDIAAQGTRRSPMEMVCDILGVLSQGPAKPTHILQRANMSWKVLSSHLEYLYGNGFVERVEQGEKRIEYKLTQKGRVILQMYEDLRLSLSGASGFYPNEVPHLVATLPSAASRSMMRPW
jgi:predicted transcriptional regulator